MELLVAIPTTPYVYRYLLAKYGEGPYDLRRGAHNPLRVSLEHFQVFAEVADHLGRIPYTIELVLPPDLAATYETQASGLSAGMFFEHEFVESMRTWVEAQVDLGHRTGLPQQEANKYRALIHFFERHGIREEDYSLEAAYRRLTRHREADGQYLREKLVRKYRFCPYEKPADRRARRTVARIGSDGRGARIRFWATSAEAGRVVEKTHRIPAKLFRQGDAEWKPYARSVMGIISELVNSGWAVDGPAPNTP